MELYTFAISHFSEKARWALDVHRIDVTEQFLVPGPHLWTVRRLGVQRSTVPVLRTPSSLQGSSEIITYLDDQVATQQRLTPTSEPWEDLEKRIDSHIGFPIRNLLYHELLEHPDYCIQLWSHGGPWWASTALRAAFPLMRSNLRRACRHTPEGLARSTQQLEDQWIELESIIEQRPYLVGDRFSRVDLTAAALLAPLVQPPEHPFPFATYPQPIGQTSLMTKYQDRPLWHWVRRMYRDHRQGSLSC